MFEIDSQTLQDLQTFPTTKGGRSVIGLFEAASHGGRLKLESLFRKPLSDIDAVRGRSECIEYMESNGIRLDIDPKALDFIEHYLSLTKVPTQYSFVDGLRKKWLSKLQPSNEYYIITRGVKWVAEFVQGLGLFASPENIGDYPELLKSYSGRIRGILSTEYMAEILAHKSKRFSSFQVEKFDHILRYRMRDGIRELLDIVYTLDVFQAVIKAKNRHGFTYARLGEAPHITAKGLRHPLIDNPVPNDIEMDSSRIVFVTGANMAGKSTFMKSVGIAIYLAHMGFPVLADAMHLSVFDGLFTTINVPDDLSLGYSHFYSEVKRVKSVAEKVGGDKKYVVIFDELFRGTNVKDAHEGTVAVIGAFADIGNSFFLFSSHIIEAAESLAVTIPGMQFKAFGTTMKDDTLQYSYKMYDGISEDRFGMYIIQREGIVNLLLGKH